MAPSERKGVTAGEEVLTLKVYQEKKRLLFLTSQAAEVYLTGEFNDWKTRCLHLKKNKGGLWQARVTLPPNSPASRLFVTAIGSKVFLVWSRLPPALSALPDSRRSHARVGGVRNIPRHGF